MTGIIRWKRHLSEERLFDCYLADRNGEGIDPPAAEHLADCHDCHARFAELAGFMAESWSAAEAETSAIFTPDRLQMQRQEIARRVELVGQSGRVLSFRASVDGPSRETDMRKSPASSISRTAAGWIAAAAAAGLFVGVGAGMFYDGRARGPAGSGTVISRPGAVTEPARTDTPTTSPASTADDDDAMFFSELQAALDRPRTPELVALDAMTPRVQEISYRIR